MRVLVAGRNAKVLAKAAGTFANDLQIQTAATKAACLALLQRTQFDLIVACETLADGSGLEVLSHVAVNTPNTLRIFAARPSTLNLLKGELGLFGLFRTLPYPISFHKLWAAINLARSTCAEAQPPKVAASESGVRKPTGARTPAPIPQSEAFKRALAKRNAAKLEANSNFGTTDLTQSPPQFNNRGRGRPDPGMTHDSLTHLAKLAAAGRSKYDPRGAAAGKKRAAFFVGSGVFAATTAAVLSFFIINANNSMERSKLPLLASITRPVPNKVFPWQPEPQQPTPQMTFMKNESTAPAAADLEVEAEAASENFEIEPGHPGPPQPNAPPPPSEPPSLESPAQPVDE
jgi:DNA-binding NarL/FixJ family response regulator